MPNREFFRAEQGISCAEQGVCSVPSPVHRIALRLHDQDDVAILRVAGVSPNPVHRAVTDGAPFRRQLALANGTTKGAMLQPLVRREPASSDACILSGFNLLIAAYSYIVNPDLDTAKRLCRGYRRRDAEKRRRSFSSAGRLHLEDCAKSVPCIRTTGSAYTGAPAVQETGRRGGRRV